MPSTRENEQSPCKVEYFKSLHAVIDLIYDLNHCAKFQITTNYDYPVNSVVDSQKHWTNRLIHTINVSEVNVSRRIFPLVVSWYFPFINIFVIFINA